jgi:phosphate starvation-inducible PhoH-like protein
MSGESSVTLTLADRDEAVHLFGHRDQYLRLIKEAFPELKIIARGDTIQINGPQPQVERAERSFAQLRQTLQQQGSLSPENVRTALAVAAREGEAAPGAPPQPLPAIAGSRHVRPRTAGQSKYVTAMRENDVTFAIGPAGTGKTYLGVAVAVTLLRQGAIKKIVLVRPAVEAGEKLGFLPGDIAAKINPYLRPLLDALNDMMEPEQVKRYMENDIIEIAPLAFMRGRAQPLSSQVLTPEGFRPIGSLGVGDSVIGSDGRPTTVQGVYPQGRKEVYKVTFTDAATTRCCGEHLWTVYTCDDRTHHRGPRVVALQDMIGNLRSHHRHRYELPLLSGSVEFPWQDLPLDPYALGLLLGDGCPTGSTTPAFATADPELVAALQECLHGVEVTHKSGVDYMLNARGRPRGSAPNPVTKILRELGLCGTRSGTKFVPACYLYNTAEVRHAVLQGLLDTDGGPVQQKGRTCRVQFCTTSPRLRDDVIFLTRSLGGVAYWRTRPAAGRAPGFANGRPVPYRADAFVLDIRLPDGFAPFRLGRKARRVEESGHGRPMRFFAGIEPDGVEETVCINVAAADCLYVTDDFLLTHNTLNAAVIILDEGQNTTVPQMQMFLTRMGHGSKIIVTGDITQVDLPKNTRSGLVDATRRLQDLERIAIVYLGEQDIVRHPLVQAIVKAYEEDKPKRRRSEA